MNEEILKKLDVIDKKLDVFEREVDKKTDKLLCKIEKMKNDFSLALAMSAIIFISVLAIAVVIAVSSAT